MTTPTAQDYQLKQGETPDQYNARIAELRGYSTPSASPDSSSPTALPGASSSIGDLSNLRVALRSALTEATQQKSKSRIEALSPLLEGGAAPNVIGAAVGLAQQGLKQTQENYFNDIMTGVKDAQQSADQARRDTLNSINTMIDNGVFSDMPDGAILTLEKQAGLPEGTVLAWKARLTQAQKQSDEKAAKELQLIQSQINENIAQTNNANVDTSGNGSPGDTKFWSRIDATRNELQQGETWGSVWNRIKTQFPSVSNEKIDNALGGGIKDGVPWGWARSGASQEFQSANSGNAKWQAEAEVWKQLSSPEMINQPDDIKASYVQSQGFNPADFNL